MKVFLYRQSRYGKYYITDYKSNIDFTHTNAIHLATEFDTTTQKDEIDYLKNTFGFDYKSERVNDQKIQTSKALNRVYI